MTFQCFATHIKGLQQNTHQSIKVHPVRRLSLNSGLWRDWADNEKPWCSTRASTCWKDHQVQALLQALLVRPQLKVAIPHLYEQAYVEPSTDMPWCGLDLKFVSLRVRLEDVQLADCQSAGFHHLKMDSLPLVFIQPARLAYLIRFT